MWDLTGEPSLLAEAVDKFPDDPRVCLGMIHREPFNLSDAMPWIHRFIAIEPQNPHGYFLKAWALMTGNDHAGAITTLCEAAALHEVRDNYLRARMITVREAALASGASAGKATRLTIAAGISNSTLYDPPLSALRAIRDLLADAVCSGREDTLLDAARVGLATADLISRSIISVLTEDLVAITLRIISCRALPEKSIPGPDHRTAGSLTAEAEAEYNRLHAMRRGLRRAERFTYKAGDAAMSEFMDYYLQHGERAAFQRAGKQAGIWR